eukprot:2048256-Prorocentrum_lima.AAC.1
MTSSLVGSEMCIRDRAKKLQLASAQQELPKKKSQGGIGSNQSAGHMCSCLLYTSDAADDM